MEDNARLPGFTKGAKVISIKRDEVRVRVISDVVYSQSIAGGVEAKQLRMTLYIPESKGPHPAVLFFPGGGWLQSARDRFAENRFHLAKAGFVVAAAEYHTIPCRHPRQLCDGLTAVRFLKTHADAFGLDPERVGVFGSSAGGWLAAMVTLTGECPLREEMEWPGAKSDVRSCCLLHPVIDLSSIAAGLSAEYQMAHRAPTSPEALLVKGITFKPEGNEAVRPLSALMDEASPIELLRKKPGPIPPFLIMHGSADTKVSPLQSAAFFNELKSKWVDADYFLLEGAEHSSDPVWCQKRIRDEVTDFFRRTLAKSS